MWSYVTFVLAAILLSGGLALLLTFDETATLAPDSDYYLALARHERVPRPFCFRPFVPKFLGTDITEWKLSTLAAVIAQGVAIALLTGELRAIVLLLMLPGGARFSLRHPVLVDSHAMMVTLSVAIAANHLPWPALIFAGMVLCTFRESAPVWLAVYSRSVFPLLGIVPMLAGMYYLFGRRTDAKLDNSYITAPFLTCLMHRQGNFFAWKPLLLPWGVVLPLALLADWQTAGLIWLISAVPLLIVSDTARVQYWAAPALIPLALVAPIPDVAWPLLLVAHAFNPYRGA